jgi:hypothetical protein
MAEPNPEDPTTHSENGVSKEITIPKEELQQLKDISDFWAKMLADDDHTVKFPENAMAKINAEFDRLKAEFLNSGESEDNSTNLRLRRKAEYEVMKDEVDYRMSLLNRLIEYIESKPNLWKFKFSTSPSYQLDKFSDKHFSGDGSESKQRDECQTFAGQSKDSIYFVTNSGVSLRLKQDWLVIDARSHESVYSFKKMLQRPMEFVFFVANRDPDKAEQEFDTQASEFRVKADQTAFEPTLEYQVIECMSKRENGDLLENSNADFKSGIKVEHSGEKVRVAGISMENHDFHQGHQVNRVWKLA